jgi:formate dehydrogenase iron-sulfur subunit
MPIGLAIGVALATTQIPMPPSFPFGIAFLMAVALAKLGFEHRIFRHLVDEQTPGLTPLNKTALLLAGQLDPVMRTRVACGLLGGIVLPALLLLTSVSGPHAGLAWGAFALCLLGELLERYLFFTAVAPAKMPGGIVE